MLSRRGMLAGAAGAGFVAAAPAIAKKATSDAAVRALHNRLLCLDTHLDTPARFPWPGWDIMQRHEAPLSQVDYPRMVEGGLDGGFWAIYTAQGPLTPEGMMAARDAALLRAAAIREMVAKHGDHFALAFASADAAKINASGKKIVYQSIENAYPLANDVTLLRSFHALGVRLCGFAHFKVNQFADSATDAPKWKGLSDAGRELLALMNELGIVPDHSHSSDDVFDQLASLSKTPILLSHSGCRAVHDHPRNLDDARLKKLADLGGVIQINSLSAYLVATPDNPDREKAAGAIYAKLRGLSGMTPAAATAAIAEASRAMKALDVQYPEPHATFEDYMAHMLHALKLLGPDHVGVGADWDGGGGVIGMEDCASNWKITARLLKEGYREDDLQKIWSGNALRVLKAAEDARVKPPAPSGFGGGGE
ncbi:MAG: dipeptidase [Alphaproteobacteria bacterium]|nr:dipeptidase [Alphaproteobacteria bacterium]MBL6936476.1 dipeptidase [Alphaproteobacteria bacterium]MBL7098473.1 dipeptidase [Alphaproteobacteria bacterium]